MPKTSVVNVKRDEFDVYIGRAMPGFAASPFRNIYKVGRDGSKRDVLASYRAHIVALLETDPKLRAELERLRGKRLGCWCKPAACHGDILVELLEGPQEPQALEPPSQGSLF